MTAKLILSVNSAWNVANFRGGLIRALQSEGWEVVAAAPEDEHVERVRALGCRFVALPMDNGGTHPWRDLTLYRRYRALMRLEQPAAFLGFTIKPNVYGSLAARSLGVPVVNNIAGLGTAFIRHTWLTHVARALYRHALRRSHRVLFQNEDDRRYFIDSGLVGAAKTARVPGSGIDLNTFTRQPLPPRQRGEPLRFLFVGRVLRDKGIVEYVEASRRLRDAGIAAEFSILGPLETQNRTAVTRAEVERWVAEGLVRYLGVANDVRPHLAAAHCVVLPSYREGVPRTLLEAASMGRPLIATDAVGCRDAVENGRNGYLVRVADAADLAEKCARFAALPPEEHVRMGQASRQKVECEFDERIVFDASLECLSVLRPDPHGAAMSLPATGCRESTCTPTRDP
jgi:glycosyltransferase involved in cell wall biosynthesis